MATHNIEAPEFAATHTLHDSTAVAQRSGQYPYAIIVPTAGNYTYRLAGNTADVTSYFVAGVEIAGRFKLLKATGAPAGVTTVTILYRQ